MVSEGDRIELISTSDPHTSLSAGDRGEVTDISTTPAMGPRGKPEKQVWVDWDSGSRLALIENEDSYRVVNDEE